MARLAGRKIIITGGASGIGRATARLFRREGAAVAILDRSDNAGKAVADEIGAVAITCDVSDPASVSGAVNRAAEAMGGLDGVINAAGILAETGIADTTAEVLAGLKDFQLRTVNHVFRRMFIDADAARSGNRTRGTCPGHVRPDRRLEGRVRGALLGRAQAGERQGLAPL